MAERFERLEETLQICRQMWSDDDGPFEGRHHQLAETICSPRPITRPRPPILIGGSGERKTLRLVARYADACNLFAADPDDVAHKLDVLHAIARPRAANRHGRADHPVRRRPVRRRRRVRHRDGRVRPPRRTTVDLMPTGDPVAFVDRVGKRSFPAWPTSTRLAERSSAGDRLAAVGVP